MSNFLFILLQPIFWIITFELLRETTMIARSPKHLTIVQIIWLFFRPFIFSSIFNVCSAITLIYIFEDVNFFTAATNIISNPSNLLLYFVVLTIFSAIVIALTSSMDDFILVSFIDFEIFAYLYLGGLKVYHLHTDFSFTKLILSFFIYVFINMVINYIGKSFNITTSKYKELFLIIGLKAIFLLCIFKYNYFAAFS